MAPGLARAKFTTRLTLAATLLASCLLSCGDPPLAMKSATDAGHDGNNIAPDGQLQTADGTPTTGDAPAGSDTELTDAADVPGGDADATQPPIPDGQIADTAAPDVQSQPDASADVPLAPFTLLATEPTNGAMGNVQPFTVKLHFSAEVKAASIAAYTIAVTTQGGVPVAGKFATVDNDVTFTATDVLSPASRVEMVLGTLVQGQKGGALQQAVTLRWYTEGMPALAVYAKLAARYAPRLLQGVTDGNDALRAVDLDGNWNANDNVKNAGGLDALATVGWSVIESPSHYFITYVFYWPHRKAVAPGVAADNDTAGSIVTVAKWPAEHPVALTTYFRAKADEQMWTWVTAESGWPKATYVRGILAEAVLFPKAKDAADTYGCEGIADCVPRRYPGYLTAGTHQSCLWSDPGESGGVLAPAQCVTTGTVKSALQMLDYMPALVAQPAGKASNPGPVTAYALQSLHDAWWPHRDEAGPLGLWSDTLFNYEAPPGRPPGPKLATGSRFVSATDDFGRPPWGWQWKPANNISYYGMPRGTPFFDPAWALLQRLGGESTKVPAWDPGQKTGFSQDYCLHPFFFLDNRATAPCKNQLQ